MAALWLAPSLSAQTPPTYAERLGFPRGKKVVIFHVDDAGMSHDSNLGVQQALQGGVATSTSVMMPCGWVPEFFGMARANPRWDVGVHLTLTSEWPAYRWQPLAGTAVPGLLDAQGSFYRSVPEVVAHASPQEVETELRAQIARFRAFGAEPSHLDSHMGTLFMEKFLPVYLKVGKESKIPVMFPGGHATLVAAGRPDLVGPMTRAIGEDLWKSGMPVVDDIFADTYGWTPSAGADEKAIQAFKTKKYIEALQKVKPGLTVVINHCTRPSDTFARISDSGPTRLGDLLAMLDPELRRYIEQEGIILTNWSELAQRRKSRP